jgi:hypothetical protein
MAQRYGGETPMVESGLRLTVEAPDATTVLAPVEAGTILKLGGTAADGSAYKAVACVDNDTPVSVVMVQALHRITSVGPLGVMVLSPYSQVRRLPYLKGEKPDLGGSVQISATVSMVGAKGFTAGCGFVLAIDTVAEDCEVLL